MTSRLTGAACSIISGIKSGSRFIRARRRHANCVIAFDGDCLAKDEVCFQNIEHGTSCATLWGIKHHIALRTALWAFAPLCFDEADLVDGNTKLFGHTCQVVAAIASNQLAIVLGHIQQLGLRVGCPSEVRQSQQGPDRQELKQKARVHGLHCGA